MPEWWTYRLSDLLLFSPRTYYRMFELYHAGIWPVHLIVLASAVAILVLIRREEIWARLMIFGLLASWWTWVGIAFHLNRYAQINWAAKYFSALFVIQGLLLLWYGAARGRLEFAVARGRPMYIGIGLLMVASVIQPIAGVLAGRTWRQVELVGNTPDPTVIATMGFLALSLARVPRALLVIPVAWCAIGGATLWALGSSEAWIVLLSGLGGGALATGYSAAFKPAPVEHKERGRYQQ